MPRSSVDNDSAPQKARVRAEIAAALTPAARILELFAGDGYLYRSVWHRFGHGATADKAADKVSKAAEERTTWACYEGDSPRMLGAGWLGSVPFDVVDVDCWGSPWASVEAWYNPRTRADSTTLILTDGYFKQRSMAKPVVCLFGPGHGYKTITPDEYTDAVRRFLLRMDEQAGTTTTVDAFDCLTDSQMRSWVLTVNRGSDDTE